MNIDEKYIRRCLQLAALGRGFTAPNPMVGAVVVHNGLIIGEGYHRKYGEAHAEVNAIASVRDESLLRESTLYVNLEPCAHYGKTPPCAELIVKKALKRVVIGHIDPFGKVSGRGAEILRQAGIEVVSGVLEEECKELNKRYLTYIQHKRPYVILKWACSSDGFMDRLREEGDGQRPFRFSNDFTQMLVHKLRAEEAAIMVGKRTMLLDKPQLNVRFWSGNDPLKTTADSRLPLSEQLSALRGQKIQSLIVEGGAKLLNSFLNEELWDEIQVEIAPFILGEGVPAPRPKGILKNIEKCENSFIFHYLNASKP
ncbi:MAG: bifunctional diaminohydroxyphosphoribosylaminopyrimidine deaminase/5-amino-6-(5-phosphoribosylamino)uracil reductase RibD [Dysgonamonadaceae bacterium]|nr:bifunctional diaminohydroxyphosphoribosylaminopyrimidine deaminase/5-amino-6-(5-phosphoribosylamino)uracil reductase RibD [Dysgonamonadaceae bacterium]